MNFKYFKLGLVSLASVAVLAGCADNSNPETPQESQAETTTSQATESSEETTSAASEESSSQSQESSASDATASFQVDMASAVDIFLEEYPEAQIEQVDFDDDDGTFEYQIDGFDDSNEYELDINAETGEIQESESDEEDDSDNDEAIDFNAIITEQEAIEIALGELGEDATIEGWQLEVDDGRTTYDIETQQDDDITIDAESGEVLEMDRDD